MILRASRELMREVIAIIRSNAYLYKDIVANEHDWSEHWVDETWADRNFSIREFYVARLGTGQEAEYVAAGSYQNLGAFAYIGYLYVKHGHHRNGYGRALMRFLETRALTENVSDLRLFCNKHSDWARKFYESLGFQVLMDEKSDILAFQEGVMVPFYEEDALFLQKVLQ